MKKIYIKDLKIGDSIFGESFAIKSYVRKASRNNRPYIDVELTDKTGSAKGKVWSDNFSNCEEVKEGDIVEVNATVDEFSGPQLNITNLKKITDFNIEDFQQTSSFDVEKMWREVSDTIENIKNPHLKKLLKNIFDSETTNLFKYSPAAYRVHHAYIGGLLEHTWEMLKMAGALKSHFPKINMDLVYSGIILHDLGKTKEYVANTTIEITDVGKLLGHIYLGSEWIKSKAPEEMPEDLLNEILHIVLAHHGEKEFGSPVFPMTTEAIAVHALDSASSKMNMAYMNINESLGTDKYTPYVSYLKTELYRSPYLDEQLNEDIPF
ncbi:MAG: HD domain-containing protein [Patescibacteria group bacterium]|nr:HD domain-containing protein [Patescibacteria group bacterium]